MKKIIYYILLSAILSSCSSFLDEKSLSIKTSENSFETVEDFNMAITGLYALVRNEFCLGQDAPFDYVYGTDLVYDGQPTNLSRFNDYEATCNPASDYLKVHWTNLYQIISGSNTIIHYVKLSSLSEDNKKIFEAKAKLFRAFCYRTLAFLYGGVPLELEVVSYDKKDYTRATYEAVLDQAILDLEFSVTILPSITQVLDGEISNLVAYHILSEIYLARGRAQDSYVAASKVIEDNNVALMNTRFGSSAQFEWADPYYDLFRPNNQNRASGNKESIWVIQFDPVLVGGYNSTTIRNGSQMERNFAPYTGSITFNNISPFLWPTSTFTGGGRGVGFGPTTQYYANTIWENSDWNDMRNSNHNFVRKFTCDNPSSPFYGQVIDADSLPKNVNIIQHLYSLYAYPSKVTTPYQHPEELFLNKSTWLLNGMAGTTYTDQYMIRLAETYLLRAEASLALGDKNASAKDINEVRNRAKAKPVKPEEVDLDYILDERMRELGVEEKRRLTLGRLGQVYRRTAEVAKNTLAKNIKIKHNLWPIPYSEIEANTGNVLEQNIGY